MPSRSREWERVRSLEECLGLLALIEDRLRTIRVQAWSEGSWDQVFADSIKALEELETLKARFSDCWTELIEQAQDG